MGRRSLVEGLVDQESRADRLGCTDIRLARGVRTVDTSVAQVVVVMPYPKRLMQLHAGNCTRWWVVTKWRNWSMWVSYLNHQTAQVACWKLAVIGTMWSRMWRDIRDLNLKDWGAPGEVVGSMEVRAHVSVRHGYWEREPMEMSNEGLYQRMRGRPVVCSAGH